MAMRVAPLGNTELVATQNMEYTLVSEYTPTSEGKKEKELDYDPSLEDDMVDDDYDYGEDFIINYGIVLILPAEYNRVSEVSEEKKIFYL